MPGFARFQLFIPTFAAVVINQGTRELSRATHESMLGLSVGQCGERCMYPIEEGGKEESRTIPTGNNDASGSARRRSDFILFVSWFSTPAAPARPRCTRANRTGRTGRKHVPQSLEPNIRTESRNSDRELNRDPSRLALVAQARRRADRRCTGPQATHVVASGRFRLHYQSRSERIVQRLLPLRCQWLRMELAFGPRRVLHSDRDWPVLSTGIKSWHLHSESTSNHRQQQQLISSTHSE